MLLRPFFIGLRRVDVFSRHLGSATSALLKGLSRRPVAQSEGRGLA